MAAHCVPIARGPARRRYIAYGVAPPPPPRSRAESLPSPPLTHFKSPCRAPQTTLPKSAAVNLLDDDALEESIPEVSKATQNRSRSWGADEDELVRTLVRDHGLRKWAFIASCLRTKTQKQVYARWRDYLQPGLTTKPWTKEEQKRLLELQAQIGNQWAELAKLMPGRSPNAIKNRFHATKRKLERHNRRLASGGGHGAAAAASAAAAADALWEDEEMEEEVDDAVGEVGAAAGGDTEDDGGGGGAVAAGPGGGGDDAPG